MSFLPIFEDAKLSIKPDVIGFDSLDSTCHLDLNMEPYGIKKKMSVRIVTNNECKTLMPNKRNFKQRKMSCGFAADDDQYLDMVITYFK